MSFLGTLISKILRESRLLGVCAALLVTSACRVPEKLDVRLYDCSSSEILELSLMDLAKFAHTNGSLSFSSREGEKFKGSWLKAAWNEDEDDDGNDIFCSIPEVKNSAFRFRWNWLEPDLIIPVSKYQRDPHQC
jgi:hypothetical protein